MNLVNLTLERMYQQGFSTGNELVRYLNLVRDNDLGQQSFGGEICEFTCIEWLGPLSPSGHGKTSYQSTSIEAHVLAYRCFYRASPLPGMVIRHKCNNPSCVNPYHLEPGTHQENMDDMVKAGTRRVYGEELQAQIKAARAMGMKLREISAKYGVSNAYISTLCKKK